MKILVMGPFVDAALARLREKHDAAWLPQIDRERLLQVLPEYDALIIRATNIDVEVMDRGARLKVVGTPAAGLDKIDLDYAKRKGITICNTPGVNSPSVAELTIGMIVAIARRIPQQSWRVKQERHWARDQGHELNGKTLGIVGFGNIGRRVARIAQAMEMQVIAYDPYASGDGSEVPLVDLERLLQESDVVAIHAPHTPETHHLIAARELDLMKDGAYIVNMSRGGIIDETALAHALAAGKIAGVGTDVLEGERLDAAIISPLLDAANAVITPHLGAWTAESEVRVVRVLVEKVLDALEHWKEKKGE